MVKTFLEIESIWDHFGKTTTANTVYKHARANLQYMNWSTFLIYQVTGKKKLSYQE